MALSSVPVLLPGLDSLENLSKRDVVSLKASAIINKVGSTLRLIHYYQTSQVK